MVPQCRLPRFLIVLALLFPLVAVAEESPARSNLEAKVQALCDYVKAQKIKAQDRPVLHSAWSKVHDAAKDVQVRTNNSVKGIAAVKTKLDRLVDVANGLPGKAADVKDAIARARKKVSDIVDAEQAAIRERVFETVGERLLPALQSSRERAQAISQQTLAAARSTTTSMRQAQQDLIAKVQMVTDLLNRPGVPKKVIEQVLRPVAAGNMSQEQAWQQIAMLVGGNHLEALSTQAKEHNYWTFTINGAGSVSALIGAEVTLPLGSPGYAFGAFREARENYNFAYVWSGAGKVGYTGEIAGGIQVGLWRAKPEELTGDFVAVTMGGGEAVAVNVAVAFNFALQGLVAEEWVGVLGSASVGWGIGVEVAYLYGGSVALLPGKVVEMIKD